MRFAPSSSLVHPDELSVDLVENIRHAFDLESYIYATQLIQAETLSTAYRLRRREFKGPGRAYCAGALVWQLNDVARSYALSS